MIFAVVKEIGQIVFHLLAQSPIDALVCAIDNASDIARNGVAVAVIQIVLIIVTVYKVCPKVGRASCNVVNVGNGASSV